MRTARFLAFFVALAVIVGLSPARARADGFSDPKASFDVDIPSLEGDKVCVLYPPRENPGDCGKVDRNQILFSQSETAVVIGAAYVKTGNSWYVFIVRREDRVSTPKPDQYDAILDEVGALGSQGVKPRELSRHRVSVGAMTVAEVELSLVRFGLAAHVFLGLLPVKNGDFLIEVLAPIQGGGAGADAFDRAMHSASFEAPTAAPVEDAAPAPKTDVTKWIILIGAPSIGGIGLVVLLVVLLGKRRKKREAAAAVAKEAERMKGVSLAGGGPLGSSWKKGD